MCFAPQRRALFRHLNLQKWSEPLMLLTLWLRNMLRATTACTFSTSQLPKVVRQWWFCTCWLRNVLRATTACTFSTSQLPKVVREWYVLYILTSKCASRRNSVHFFDISTAKSGPDLVCVVHCASRRNGVQFVISHLASWLRTRRFSEPTFGPSGATNHWKNTVFRDTFLPFRASASSFFWLFLFYSSLF